MLAAAAVLILAFGGWTTAAAAQDSVPGEVLYPIKQTQERVLLLVIVTNSGKADLHARLAEARAIEATKLAAKGSDPAMVDRTTERLEEHVRECVSRMGGELSSGRARSAGVVQVVGPRGKQYSLSHDTSVSGEISIDGRAFRFSSVSGRPLWGDPESGHRGHWRSGGSLRRSEMQERFLEQVIQFRQMRPELPVAFGSPQRARIEAAFERSEGLMLEAFLMLQALEEAHNPPE